MRRSKKVCDAPMALTTNGTIFVNVAHSNGPGDAKSLLKRALEAGGQVFVGVVVTAGEARFAKKAGHVWGGSRSNAEGEEGRQDMAEEVEPAGVRTEVPVTDAAIEKPNTKADYVRLYPDLFREPYGRAPETVPRSVVFCGTVNHGGYLRDRTGSRRFWLVRCEDTLDVAGLAEVRDALWAEALHAYRRGDAWHLDPAEEALMRDEHEERLEADPWEDRLTVWTAQRAGADFTMAEVLESGLGLSAQARSPRVMGRVSQILERLGFERRKRSARPRTYYYTQDLRGEDA
jgi:hypothetical protein